MTILLNGNNRFNNNNHSSPSFKTYEEALIILHKKEGECLKCGKWITEQTICGSLCQKCNGDFAKFEELEDEKYMAKNPNKTILNPYQFDSIFRKFIGLDKETFVMS